MTLPFATLAEHVTDEGLRPDTPLANQAMRSFAIGFRTAQSALSTPTPAPSDIVEGVHRIMHEFTGRPCRDDGGWCDARDHAELIVKFVIKAKTRRDEVIT